MKPAGSLVGRSRELELQAPPAWQRSSAVVSWALLSLSPIETTVARPPFHEKALMQGEDPQCGRRVGGGHHVERVAEAEGIDEGSEDDGPEGARAEADRVIEAENHTVGFGSGALWAIVDRKSTRLNSSH